ncbi:hypothetical protein ACFP3U_25465 [Kitasatospora misakiensis]|uniref:Uncharacterized protein n=1 Tax=Kitasatospora misakiensis TaxID=67330 RepID=A0ABW0X9C9_9ACTN
MSGTRAGAARRQEENGDGEPHVRVLARVLTAVRADSDPADPLSEARIAALESALCLLGVDQGPDGAGGEAGAELLREALGSARASVMTIGIAVTRWSDSRRCGRV